MQYITITYVFKDDGELKEFIFNRNTFDIPNNEDTLRSLAVVTVKSLNNKEAQDKTIDLLKELNIPRHDME